MQVNRLLLAAMLATAPAIADEQPDDELLEFLGGYEIELDGEWVNPLTIDIEEDTAETAQTTTR